MLVVPKPKGRHRSRGGNSSRRSDGGGGINGDENHPPQLEENEAHKRTLGAELGTEEYTATEELRKIREDISQKCQKSYWSLQSFR